MLLATTACTFFDSEAPSNRQKVVRFWLPHVLRATSARTFSTCPLPTVVREWCALTNLTSECASRHNSVHFFGHGSAIEFCQKVVRACGVLCILQRRAMACTFSTSKSARELSYFLHFGFHMCFAPQHHPLFRHLNFQKWSEHDSL